MVVCRLATLLTVDLLLLKIVVGTLIITIRIGVHIVQAV